MRHLNKVFWEKFPNELHKKIFEFENAIFSPIHMMAPSNYVDFKKIRLINKLSGSMAIQGNKIISLIVNEKLTSEHVQSVIIATRNSYRGKGLFRELSQINFNKLKSIGFKYISFWSYPKSPVFKIFSETLEPISTEPILTLHELKLRNEYCISRKIQPYNTKLRIINNFYKLNDGSVCPASFWAFNLG